MTRDVKSFIFSLENCVLFCDNNLEVQALVICSALPCLFEFAHDPGTPVQIYKAHDRHIRNFPSRSKAEVVFSFTFPPANLFVIT